MSVSVTALKQAEPVQSKVRFITAASLFDGHDASINIMRRILQASGVEVIHLGHNRSVAEIVEAALQEDAHGIAISSYQGGHVEYFKYMVDQLRAQGAERIAVFGGGGGVIVAEEIAELHDYGVEHIYSPADGQSLGLQGMIDDMIQRTRAMTVPATALALPTLKAGDSGALSRVLSALEQGVVPAEQCAALREQAQAVAATVPVLGITGTGGSGKSSLTDEVVLRFRLDFGDSLKIALLAIDPTRRKTGGALLGDRIRMNAIDHENIYMRSIATRDAKGEVPDYLSEMIAATRLAGFDLIMLETPGIGQGDAGIVGFSDVSLYVMTPEYGAASQLEKIDMLDYADLVAINKYDRNGAEDALRDVRKQFQRNSEAFDRSADEMPVFGTIAARFSDDGVSGLYHELLRQLRAKGLCEGGGQFRVEGARASSRISSLVPADRKRYLAEIAQKMREHKANARAQAEAARACQQLREAARMLVADGGDDAALQRLLSNKRGTLSRRSAALLADWPGRAASYSGAEQVSTVRGREIRTPLLRRSLSGTDIPRIALPKFSCEGELLQWLLVENLPGFYPFTAGVFPFKREGEDPTRMFAGEGDAARTNARFKQLSEHSEAKRLSTAFDSVTLYGNDPHLRPDIYGKVGNAGVSVCTVEDMAQLYDGFDLCHPGTSVSMTINGPAPIVLAFYFNAAIKQQLAKFALENGREPDQSERHELRTWTLKNVRGTVQADILKEDQGQNTCLFSTEFSLKLMGDIQQFFVDNAVRNFYSVSISGYHIAEAGANPISQLAFTLANGFTYVESYLARGMAIDDFAPNLSFFFSNGMDPEYTVLGRVARRIWAVAMCERYGANERSQKLKYHIQTSGRSLHAQEMDFNDIRTTLQALIAIYDNCNSLHTNAFDEAVTTPSAESVRRALAIQLIINREWGLASNENPLQGSFVIEELSELLEEAVLQEFERISERGGVLGAMETGYQRAKIQEESMLYEHKKHDGSLPIVGVNTFLNPAGSEQPVVELSRSTDEEKQRQLSRLTAFQKCHVDQSAAAIAEVQQVAMAGENVFAALVEAVEHCSLGQLTQALFAVGGKYRRNM